MGGKGSGRKSAVIDEQESNEQQSSEQESDDQIVASVTRSPEREKKSLSQSVMDALGLGQKSVVQPVAKATRKAPTRKARSGKELSADFVAALVPILALGIAVFVRMRIRDDRYKIVAPQTDEISKVLTPLARILARRIEIAGKMTEDTLDLSIALTMMGVMASRMYADYIKIGERQSYDQQASNLGRNYRGGYSEESAFSPSANNSSHSGTTGSNGSRAGAAVTGSDHSAISADGWSLLDGKQADDIISKALAADAHYRAANGLL